MCYLELGLDWLSVVVVMKIRPHGEPMYGKKRRKERSNQWKVLVHKVFPLEWWCREKRDIGCILQLPVFCDHILCDNYMHGISLCRLALGKAVPTFNHVLFISVIQQPAQYILYVNSLFTKFGFVLTCSSQGRRRST